MIVRRILNNSVVDALDESSREVIVLGKGIGFTAKPGDTIDPALIEKIFRLDDPQASSHFAAIVADIPAEVLSVTGEIVALAKEELAGTLSDSVYAALADHLTYAIQRAAQTESFINALDAEIRRFYPTEHAFSLRAVAIVNERLGVTLPVDEATNITLHLINAETGGAASNASRLMELSRNVLDIVRLHFALDYSDSDPAYLRLITHVRFFAQRVLLGETIERDDDDLLRFLQQQKPEIFACIALVENYVRTHFDHTMSSSERMFLALHISRFV